MGIYNTFEYGDGTLYGNQSKLEYSAEPVYSTALGVDVFVEQQVVGLDAGDFVYGDVDVTRPKVRVSWVTPSGTIQGFRLVRNQLGYPEHEEDGVVVVETYVPSVPAQEYIVDQLQGTPLVPGQYVYYTVWVLLADNSWRPAGHTYCVVPKEHALLSPTGERLKSSERKFVELFPKVFTTEQQSYLDEVDEASDIFGFLGGFAYTLDEVLTNADLLIPKNDGLKTNPNIVDLQRQQMGLPAEPTLGLQRKKALVRNAIDLYKAKGSLNGIGLLAESLTGLAPVVYLTRNKMLSLQDSTFYKGIGNWAAGTGVTLTSDTTAPYQSQTYSVDRTYVGKAITSGTNRVMQLGMNSPITKAVPITGGQPYILTYYVKGSTNNVSATLTWYDMFGQATGSAAVETASAATGSWVRRSLYGTAPTAAYYVGIEIKFAASGTYYVDMLQVETNADLATQSSYSNYEEARGVVVRLEPTKVNYIYNPSFDNTTHTDPTDWVWTGINAFDESLSTTAPGIFDGSHMLELETIDGTNFTLTTRTDPIISGNSYYTFSVYAKTDASTEAVSFKLGAYGEAGTLLLNDDGSTAETIYTPTGGVTSTWTRYSVRVFVPTNDEAVYLKVTILGEGSGNFLYFDASLLEKGYLATDYFDGNYNQRGAYWLGTVNDSMSVMYRNKTTRLDRFVHEIKDYLPLNTSYVVTSGFNGTYSLEGSGLTS